MIVTTSEKKGGGGGGRGEGRGSGAKQGKTAKGSSNTGIRNLELVWMRPPTVLPGTARSTGASRHELVASFGVVFRYLCV